MIQSPFLSEVYACKSLMKKLRKKIYKFNINKPTKKSKSQSTIKDAITLLQKRGIPNFLQAELEKFSDLTFSSLSGFSLSHMKPLSEISDLTRTQEQQIFGMYYKNKRTINRRKSSNLLMKLQRRETSSSDTVESELEQAGMEEVFDVDKQDSEDCEQNVSDQQLFGTIGNSNSLDQDYHNSDAMFQSTMLDFGNEIEMDSEQFLFRY